MLREAGTSILNPPPGFPADPRSGCPRVPSQPLTRPVVGARADPGNPVRVLVGVEELEARDRTPVQEETATTGPPGKEAEEPIGHSPCFGCRPGALAPTNSCVHSSSLTKQGDLAVVQTHKLHAGAERKRCPALPCAAPPPPPPSIYIIQACEVWKPRGRWVFSCSPIVSRVVGPLRPSATGMNRDSP